MSIFITGDTHGDFTRFSSANFPEGKELTKEDYIIICGDFGGIWNPDRAEEKYWMKWLSDKPWTTLFCDGNHENFHRLCSYPEIDFHGGKAHQIAPNIYHLMRGYVFTFEEKKIFVFGGASSHDIQDGILDPSKYSTHEFSRIFKEWERERKCFRVKNISWWEEELPNPEEMERGLQELKKVNHQVDFVISHCAPSSIQAIFSMGLYQPDLLTNYLDIILKKTDFKKWFFGHYHMNQVVLGQFLMLYEQIIQICEREREQEKIIE